MKLEKYAILIPAYNIDALSLNKTFRTIPKDAHVLIVDDGSVNPVSDLVNNITKEYKNVRVHRLDKNRGIENALNSGLAILKNNFEYVARLDMGDESVEGRFEKQVDFLDSNKDYVLVGSWVDYYSESGDWLFTSKLPVDDKDIRKKMYINNMIVHPAVMLRMSAIAKIGEYSTQYKACEDYDLFFRLMKIGKAYNIPEVLLKYEINYNSISSKKRLTQVLNRLKLILRNYSFISCGFYPYYGLIRNIAIVFLDRRVTMFLRKILKK